MAPTDSYVCVLGGLFRRCGLVGGGVSIGGAGGRVDLEDPSNTPPPPRPHLVGGALPRQVVLNYKGGWSVACLWASKHILQDPVVSL